MFKRSSSFIFTLALLVSFGLTNANAKDSDAPRVRVPLNIAILIQDDLTSQVANEIGVTKEFIRSLPAGSRVMVAYITSGSLQVRQSFTTDLNRAASSLRIPRASTGASAFNPYVEVVEALKKFDPSWRGNNAVLLISDGLDVSRGFDSTLCRPYAGHQPHDQGSESPRCLDLFVLRAVGGPDEPQPYRGKLRTKLSAARRRRNWWPGVLPGR